MSRSPFTITPLNADQSFASHYSPSSYHSTSSSLPFMCEEYPTSILHAPHLRTIELPKIDDENDVPKVYSENNDVVIGLEKSFELSLILHSQTHIVASDEFYDHQRHFGALQIDFGHENAHAQVSFNKYAYTDSKRQVDSPFQNDTPPSSPLKRRCSLLKATHPYYHTSALSPVASPQPILSY